MKAPKPITLPNGKAWRFMPREKKRELLRAIMGPTLENCTAYSLTVEDERLFVLDSLVEALLGEP
jgi:hypothetical protein